MPRHWIDVNAYGKSGGMGPDVLQRNFKNFLAREWMNCKLNAQYVIEI